MITSLQLVENDKDKTSEKYGWARNVAILAKSPVTFNPGLNILFGPNGSGKSTIAGLCAHLTASEQGGESCITETWLRDLVGHHGKTPVAKLVHDGQPTVYINPRSEIGLLSGGAAFDDDFLSLGVASMFQRRQSTGQVSFSKMERAISLLVPQNEPDSDDRQARKTNKNKQKTKDATKTEYTFPTAIGKKIYPERLNDLWKGIFSTGAEILKGTTPIGQRTIILDEPESGFSLPWQEGFWNNVMQSETAKTFQIIVATHSPFALGIDGANYIETEAGYVAKCEAALERLSANLLRNAVRPKRNSP